MQQAYLYFLFFSSFLSMFGTCIPLVYLCLMCLTSYFLLFSVISSPYLLFLFSLQSWIISNNIAKKLQTLQEIIIKLRDFEKKYWF